MRGSGARAPSDGTAAGPPRAFVPTLTGKKEPKGGPLAGCALQVVENMAESACESSIGLARAPYPG